MAEVRLRVNGAEESLAVQPWVSLLDLLRERLGLTGTKKGCAQGACGACTVLVDGERINSCLALAVQYDGREITAIEGLGSAARTVTAPVRCRRRSSRTTVSSAATARQAKSAPRSGCLRSTRPESRVR